MKDETVSLRLPGAIVEWIEAARGDLDRSAYITKLIEERVEQARQEPTARSKWLAEGRQQYSAELCRETLQINDQFPIDEE